MHFQVLKTDREQRHDVCHRLTYIVTSYGNNSSALKSKRMMVLSSRPPLPRKASTTGRSSGASEKFCSSKTISLLPRALGNHDTHIAWTSKRGPCTTFFSRESVQPYRIVLLPNSATIKSLSDVCARRIGQTSPKRQRFGKRARP